MEGNLTILFLLVYPFSGFMNDTLMYLAVSLGPFDAREPSTAFKMMPGLSQGKRCGITIEVDIAVWRGSGG